MDAKNALAIIKRHKAELEALGVVSLSLFGSTARDEAEAGSDIDVAVRLQDSPSGFQTLGRLDQIRERLSELLGVEVDIIPEPEEPGRMKAAIDKDRRLAF